MKLYGYWRSSAAYRVRIALALKGLPYQAQAVHLAHAEQHHPDYAALNPQQLVPLLIDDDGSRISQSLAIIEYLDETRPAIPLLPADAKGRAQVRALALSIACDIHPLNNLRVLNYLKAELALDEGAKNAWIAHWISLGLGALESRLSQAQPDSRFCHGEQPGLADCCLIPQLYNARRFAVELAPYPRLLAIEAACSALPAFAQAHPQHQDDAG